MDTVRQRLRVCGRHSDCPAAIRRNGGLPGLTVKGNGDDGTRRQIGALTGNGNVRARFGRVQHVVPRHGVEGKGSLRGNNVQSDRPGAGGRAVALLHHDPGVRTGALRGELRCPLAVGADDGCGNHMAAGIDNRNLRARIAGTAEGGSGIVSHGLISKNTLTVALRVGHEESRFCDFHRLSVINDFGFSVTAAAVAEQRPGRACAQHTGQQIRPLHGDFGGAEQQRINARQWGFHRRQRKRRGIMRHSGVGEIHLRHLLIFILKDQFILVFLTNILEISYAANDRSILHMNKQIVATAFVAGDILYCVVNNDNAGFIHRNSGVTFCSESIFKRRFTRDNIHGSAHDIVSIPCISDWC